MSQVTLGGDRLGSGNKQKVNLRNYDRSTHDLGYKWRSTMASGTLVPFMSELGLPGDTFDIDLDIDIMTGPTTGPLFGSFKVQLDVFACPIRLYNGKLHMNMLNIGLDMAKVKLPQILIAGNGETREKDGQINPSSIFSYLGIEGLGRGEGEIQRSFNAVPYLSYMDIYKQYYANKQEEIGAIIHNPMMDNVNDIKEMKIQFESNNEVNTIYITEEYNAQSVVFSEGTRLTLKSDYKPNLELITLNTSQGSLNLEQMFYDKIWNDDTNTYTLTNQGYIVGSTTVSSYTNNDIVVPTAVIPQISTFPLENIDTMREDILMAVKDAGAFEITSTSLEPYNLPLQTGDAGKLYSATSKMEGLLLKTYQSDLFNNWISTEWIDGDTGINAITSIDTTQGSFTIDTLQLSKKVYDMLNRIAVSGGTYDDWLNASYTHERTRGQENPAYVGGLIRELAFQEILSTAATTIEAETQPLGTLAGKGVMTGKNKGGKIKVKIDEPSYVIGIVSLTPRIDFSGGVKWDTNLKTMADLHQPALDEIGFQDLNTGQMNAYEDVVSDTGVVTHKSAGKQPAWINYMTNVNQVKGNFATDEQMWMTLNRRYEIGEDGIEDLTTYIDPSKFNHIFADVRLDAQNFWVQINVENIARRKMSAKLMPNL
jgi:hypothetical protein